MGKKDDLPAMPFYVGDWLKAPDIQCLPFELKGVWFEMLCFMWESQERGYLNYSTDELARLLRMPEDLLKQKLEQLLKRGIYSIRESDGAIYSRRMVRDQEIREIRKKAGSLGGKVSFANRFAQAKTQANAEDEIEYETENKKKDKNVKNIGGRMLLEEEYFLNLLPIDLDPQKILIWADWVDYRKECKKKLTKRSAKAQIDFLLKQSDFIGCINQSIKNQWQGLFEEKTDKKQVEYKPSSMNKNCVYCGKPTTTIIDRKPVCNFEHLTLYNSKTK